MAGAASAAPDSETRYHMPGKIILTIDVDANEAEILIAALRDQAAKAEQKDKAEILDRLAYEIEEQVG
jgi:hypothetical protein